MDIKYSQTGKKIIAMATSPMAEVEGVVPGTEGVLKRRDLEGRRKDHYNYYFVQNSYISPFVWSSGGVTVVQGYSNPVRN